MRFKKLVYLLFLSIVTLQIQALEIKGTIKLQDDWQPVVYLASLNSPENLFVASPEFVIAETFIQPDGQFLIQTPSVPNDLRFYRLYLVKGKNSTVEFNTNTHRNYIHLLLEQNSKIEIEATVVDNTLFISEILGSDDNNTILYFDKEIAKRKIQFTTDITKAKSDFLTQDMEKFIRNFVDTVPNSLVGLYALFHIDEKNTDFIQNSAFYFNFQKRITKQFPGSFYVEKYNDLLDELVGFRQMVCEIPGVQPRWKDNLLIAQSILILILLIALVFVLVKARRKKLQVLEENDKTKNSFLSLTVKEREILRLLADGKTNKEIANELFVELSTVKTHINSIYKQLHLANRKEAIDYFHSFNS